MDSYQKLIDQILQAGEKNVVNPVKNLLGIRKVIETPAELPFFNTISDFNSKENNYRTSDPLWGLPRSTLPTNLPSSISAYRADPTGKYGGKEGIETLPLSRLSTGGDRNYKVDTSSETSTVYSDPQKATQQLYRYARLNGAANKLGLPNLSPEDIAAFVLKEGRTDLGYNALVADSPKDKKFQDDLLSQYNIPREDANFLTMLYAKDRVAKKLGIPFAMAWAGTGTNELGQSGKDYAKNYEAHSQAARHVKNKGLLDLVNQAVNEGQKYGLPLKANLSKDVRPTTTYEKYQRGGGVSMPAEYKVGGRVKLI